MVTMAFALNEMTADPEAFLRHYVVMIGGGKVAKGAASSGVATFLFYFAGDGSHNNLAWIIHEKHGT